MSKTLWLPSGYSWRELWEARNIVGTKLPSSIAGGNAMTILGGAPKSISCEGVKFTGAADSNINCGALYNSAAKLWISLRFKLASEFTAGAPGYLHIFGKANVLDSFFLRLSHVSGKLYLAKYDAAGAQLYGITSAELSWSANTWYHVLVSFSSVNTVRMIVNGGTAITSADTSNAPAGGDLVFGDSDDPGAGTGFKGILSDIVVGTDDLTTTEEANLYKGEIPIDAVNFYPLTTGYGTAAYDSGSGSNNGTLDAAAAWKKDSTSLPVLSLNGINSYCTTAANVVDMGGAWTMVWVGKMKSTYNATSHNGMFMYMIIDGSSRVMMEYRQSSDAILSYIIYPGGSKISSLGTTRPVIDDYWVLVQTYNGSVGEVYYNGIKGTGATAGLPFGTGLASVYLGADPGASYNFTTFSLAGLVSGALTAPEVQKLTKTLRNHFGF